MFSSIQAAARWTGWRGGLTHWAVVLGDQPHVRLETLSALLDFGAAHPAAVSQPVWDGHRRHPVLLPRQVMAALGDSTAASFKEFLRSHPSASCPVTDAGLGLDLDRPEDYERALKLFGSE